MNKFILALALGTVLAVSGASATFANTPTNITITERVSSAGPRSFQVFCVLNPSDCRPGGASRVALTEDALNLMNRVNSRVNRSIRPRVDPANLQIWNINPASGDCKSYAISKRHELIRAGMPASALRIAFVVTRDGQNHAILVVKTDRGDLALDNLTGEIKPFRDAGYRLVAMSQADPRRWS